MARVNKSAADADTRAKLTSAQERLYAQAEALVKAGKLDEFAREKLDPEIAEKALALKDCRHHGRGLAAFLAIFKAIKPDQDIRAYQRIHDGGFDARGIESAVFLPFLGSKRLRSASGSHFLTRRFADGAPYSRERPIRTQKKLIGEVFLDIILAMQDEPKKANAEVIAVILIGGMIMERNQGDVPLTRPKGQPIQTVLKFLEDHINFPFEDSRDAGPRLAQLALYAIYECILPTSKRYEGCELVPLERLKAANRKSGTVGDVDVLKGAKPIEAVEAKFKDAITLEMVNEAIKKIETKDVKRYFILSTSGVVSDGEEDKITARCRDFYYGNGCEIIVNGVFETIRYYLRLIGSTDDFISRYVDLVAADKDLTYEHKQAWNLVTKIG